MLQDYDTLYFWNFDDFFQVDYRDVDDNVMLVTELPHLGD